MIIKSEFQPAYWLRNTHLQTIWSSLFRKISAPETIPQRIELEDGDFIDLEWLPNNKNGDGKAILLLLHGLEGSIDSSYIQGLLQVGNSASWTTVVMHFRGCSKEVNRLPRSYHSGETEDLQTVLKQIRVENSGVKIMVAGFSLGGNVLLKYLGETRNSSLIDYAVAISVPFLLDKASIRLDSGFSRLYRNRLLSELKKKFINRYSLFSQKLSISREELKRIKTFFDFDDKITAPLHDFTGADDYYSRSSSRQYLSAIETPTLVIHALDDPFMNPEVIPTEYELSRSVTLELSERGGHVGFVSGLVPWRAKYYIDQRVPSWFKEQLESCE